MKSKIRQVTDAIHGTIFISETEHLMMSTPFFHRLHDVYQSSTVYMTYPSNRTKRYEHSLGTMELAGQMFYSAITNAATQDRIKIMNGLGSEFFEILKFFSAAKKPNGDMCIYRMNEDLFARYISDTHEQSVMIDKIYEANISGRLTDPVLTKQEVCFFDIITSLNLPDQMKWISLYSFLYQCTLEAVRIAALFHDIGHPPFSHIIEHTMLKLYDIDLTTGTYNRSRVKQLKNTLKPFVKNVKSPNMILGDTPSNNPALHEQIGLNMLFYAFNGVIKQKAIEEDMINYSYENLVKLIYITTIIEFTFAILLEKGPIFEALHRIIDGPIDSDRLDYIVRDSANSGVDWGMIPYQRIINSLQFKCVGNEKLVLAFPDKVTDDIDDIIVNRYKIFQRINYHHKSIKTSELLRRSVEALAIDYLKSKDTVKKNTKENQIIEEAIVPEIKELWCSLDSVLGQEIIENKISKWTDSWLISVLNTALIHLSDHNTFNIYVKNYNKNKVELEHIKTMLEEVLLNRKHYYPLLKRHRDAIKLKDSILEKSGISRENIQKLIEYEQIKLHDTDINRSISARESLFRLSIFENQVCEDADLSLLSYILLGSKSCEDIIQDTLSEKRQKDIANNSAIPFSYFISKNEGNSKLGISDNTEIYLYSPKGDIYIYNIIPSLKKKLIAQRAGMLWLFVYIRVPSKSETEIRQEIDDLFDEISGKIGDNLLKAFNDLFDYDNIINNKKNY